MCDGGVKVCGTNESALSETASHLFAAEPHPPWLFDQFQRTLSERWHQTHGRLMTDFSFIQITDHHLLEYPEQLREGFSPGHALRMVMKHIAENVAEKAD